MIDIIYILLIHARYLHIVNFSYRTLSNSWCHHSYYTQILSLCIAEVDYPSSYGQAYEISGILWLTLSSETTSLARGAIKMSAGIVGGL